MSDQRHAIAGRMVGRSGVVTFCYCGLAFFIAYDGEETFESRTAAREGADERWSQHWKQVRPEQWLIAHPESGPKETS
jgi:hypothetical protein